MTAQQVRDALFDSPPSAIDPYRIGASLKTIRAASQDSNRVCAQNLLVVCSEAHRVAGWGQALRELGELHPGRTVVAVLDPASPSTDLEAWYRIEERGETVLVYAPTEGALLQSLLATAWQDCIPLVLWWVGNPPYEAPWFEQLVESSTRVIVDTGGAMEYPDGPAEAFEALKGLVRFVCDPYHQEQTFSDLTWSRLLIWREWIAGLFDQTEQQEWLETMDTLTLAWWAPPERHGLFLSALFVAGWLTRQFRWRVLERVQPTGTGTFRARLETRAGRSFELRLVEHPGQHEEEMFRMKGAWFEGAEFKMSVQRVEEAGLTLTRSIESGGKTGELTLQHRTVTRPELLDLQLSRFLHDHVFEGALQMALDLVDDY